MSTKDERIARSHNRKPQLNYEANPADKKYFNEIAKARGMKLATLVRELLFDEGRRLGLTPPIMGE